MVEYDMDMDGQPIHAGVILCAGLSSRMKDFKPLLPMDGGPRPDSSVIECSIHSMVSAGIDHIALVLGYRGADIALALQRGNYPFLKTAYNPRYADADMMESARIGLGLVQSWPEVEAVFVLPGDMPKIHPRTYGDLIQCMRRNAAKVVIPRFEGEAAHPPLIHADCLDYLVKYGGPGGLKAALDAFLPGTVYLDVEDRGCVLDADTPGDYQRLLDYHKD
jgi:CTP:molybdopterin cytidylyltransferase MocA